MTSYSSVTHQDENIWQTSNVSFSVKSNILNREDYESLVTSGLDIVEGYKKCKKLVIDAGFKAEIDWQCKVNIGQLTESTFLREHAWVTLSSGMREGVVHAIFQRFTRIFYNWKSAEVITKNEDICRKTALRVFANKKRLMPYCKLPA